MNTENARIIRDFLGHADAIGDDIMADVEELFGTVPFIFRYLRERPETFALTSLAEYATSRPESLDAKTAELVTIAAAAASESPECLKVHIGAALKAGAGRDEVLDTILLACLIGKTRLLASSLRAFRDVTEPDGDGE